MQTSRDGRLGGDAAAVRGPLRLPGLDDVEHECWRQFSESATRIGDLLQRTLTREHGFSLHDVMLLQTLATAPAGSARMGDLADALVLLPSRLTQQVARMEGAGLVVRSVSPQDRRGVVASITDAGRVRLGPALDTYARVVRSHFLDPVTRRQMTSIGDSCRRVGSGFVTPPQRPKPLSL
ncbi:hypothetical protein BCA37_08780 [Mycobacterium sp. djl-10]|nr:hypothetical protein BCA37_08780 [Mycobacterium sp. djl-10]